jgi:hypothetical protein
VVPVVDVLAREAGVVDVKVVLMAVVVVSAVACRFASRTDATVSQATQPPTPRAAARRIQGTACRRRLASATLHRGGTAAKGRRSLPTH